MTTEQIRTEVAKFLRDLNHRPPFDRPLKFGDAEQARILTLLNGDKPFCPSCWRTGFFPYRPPLGASCPKCNGGPILPGAKMTQEAVAC